jgi:hypothetical protein
VDVANDWYELEADRNVELNAEIMRAIVQEIRKKRKPGLLVCEGLGSVIPFSSGNPESNRTESLSTMFRGA